MDMTPPAIYHYFTSLDDLITALIADNYNAQADAMEAACEAEPGDVLQKLLAVLMAYRQWAMDHPVDFQLIYGNPIPGYEAPDDETLPAAARGFITVTALIEELFQTGLAVPTPPYDRVPDDMLPSIKATIERDGALISPLTMYLSVVGWGQLHGVIMLELFNHIQDIVGDSAAYYREQVYNLLQVMGVKL
jgi:AcrR family transcriptional regulator